MEAITRREAIKVMGIGALTTLFAAGPARAFGWQKGRFKGDGLDGDKGSGNDRNINSGKHNSYGKVKHG
jgi:hypothetical protein